ncbi:MAG: hypothetical protein COT34_01740 [Candidatus Nealsonbacteria bacterium CG08_land_8_20_14_0_20_43_11]|uniref:4-vinyl reductase 4VR domain-containing protein n=1 Tax=Candidatus Nealsonbacteria bacterium CG08_land_8_20_14_0_20_43_11 TaxID=1974706 RepID=A0A2M6T0R9_9BACT|nr:MAG: hypothetical protein COT34_01740 [Candidatus Nealsonbacteria bacterium CG08_land_8_20_14_0_20_43_11]
MENQLPLSKEEARRLVEIPCLTRGEEISGAFNYIKVKYGQDGLKKVEENLKELGQPISFSELRLTAWYPEGLNVLVILAGQQAFGWTEKDIFEIGRDIVKVSFIAKILVKYVVSAKQTFELSSQQWHKFVSCGKLEPFVYNEEQRYAIWRLKGYKFHPLICPFLGGYFLGLAQNIVRSDKITIEETACMFKGAAYHEYTLRW